MRDGLHFVQAEPRIVIFEHRSAAYFKYVSTGAQNIALRRPEWAEWRPSRVAAFDSAGRLWQGARPDAAGTLDFARGPYHQDTEFYTRPPRPGKMRTFHGKA